MAFMHGAQDGQKFLGVLLLGICLSGGNDNAAGIRLPVWMMLLCSLIMGTGTSIGGKKIIKSVGMDMVKLENIRDFLLIWLERCACFYPLCLGFL